MRRIFSAAAALVLAFGAVLIGATAANADEDLFQAQTPTIFNNQHTVNFTGHLEMGDFVVGFALQNGTEPNNAWDISADCTTGIQTGTSDPAGMDFECDVPWSDTDFPNFGTYTVYANIQHPADGDMIEPLTTPLNYQPGSYTDNYTALPGYDVVFSPGGVKFTETLTGGADVAGIEDSAAPHAITTPGIVLHLEGSEGDTSCQETPGSTVCTVNGLDTGIWDVTLTQSWTDQGGDPTTYELYFYVPPAPDVSVDLSTPATPSLQGEGDTVNDTINVSGPNVSGCSSAQIEDNEGFNWSCELGTNPEGASYDYTAVETSTEASEFGSEFGAYLAGGESAQTSFSVDIPVYLPNSSYAFTTGGIVTTASPTGDADRVGIELYSLDEGDGEYYPDLLDGCPALDEGEGPYQEITDAPAYLDGGIQGCSFPADTPSSSLDPGLYDVFLYENYPGYDDAYNPDGTDIAFTVPNAPSVTSVVHNSNGTATVSGAGTSGDTVYAVADGVSAPVCAGNADGEGTWSCTTTNALAGSYTFRAYDQDNSNPEISGYNYQSGGLSAVSDDDNSVSAVLSGAGQEETPGTNTITPPPWTFTLAGIDLNNIHPGQTFTVTASGLPKGAKIDVVLHSTPITLGTTTVGNDGTLVGTYTIPMDVPVGAHEIVLTMSGSGLTPTTATQAVTIVPAAAVLPSAGGTVITTDPSKAAESNVKTAHIGEVNPGDPTAPNILTRSINTIQDVVSHPGKISAAVAIGLVLLVFATIPARLLNATVAEQYENIVRRIPRLGRRPRWWERFTAWLKGAPGVGAVLLILVTALLFGFADPHFGFNLASLRLIMGLGIALIIVEYLANLVTGAILRRRLGLGAILNVRPLGIILTVIGVVASRLLDFSPGFLIGLVLGLSLSGRKAAESAWKAVLIRSGVVVGLGLAAWIGYSALTTGEAKTETFWTELFVEVLVAVTTEGIVAILVELLPFRLLEGERLWHKNRFLWAGSYLFVLVAFIVAVVPWEGNWEALGSSLWIWITAVAVFFALCVGLYLYFRFASPFRESEEEHQEDPVEVGGGG